MLDSSYLKDKLNERITNRAIQLTDGNVANIEAYRTIVGQISGLRLASSEIDDLLKKQREAERE